MGERIVLVDIDGTIADVGHRLRYIQGDGRKDWKRFFAAMDQDPPVAELIAHVRKLARNHEIVIFTGRPDDYEEITRRWLKKHDVPFSRLLMRRAGDRRPDYEVKREMLQAIGKQRIALALDDRPLVCQMLRDEGVRVVEVTSDTANQQVNALYQEFEAEQHPAG